MNPTDQDSENEINLLDDVMDLSVVDLYILNYLIRIAGSVVRFSAFKDINEELKTTKGISRSSFYHSLKKLAEKGFVEIQDESSGKTSTVQALPKAKQAIREVNIFNIWGSVDPDSKFMNLFEAHSDIFANKTVSQQLIVSLQYPANSEVIERLSRFANTTDMLGNEETIGPLSQNYRLVDVDDQGIVQGENRYDRVIVYRYAYNQLRYPIEFNKLVTEILRVTREGANIIFLSLEDLRSTNNLILESGIGTILEETLSSQSTTNLLEILRKNNIENGQIREFRSNGLVMLVIEKN